MGFVQQRIVRVVGDRMIYALPELIVFGFLGQTGNSEGGNSDGCPGAESAGTEQSPDL